MKETLLGYPFAKVEFSTENGDIEITQKAINDENMDLDIISITTDRDVGADDCATFNISLIYRDEWYKNIRSNDLTIIKLGRGYEAKPVMFGMVDTISKSWSFIDLKPVRTVNISGRGFNKAFVQFGIGAVQEIDGGFQTAGFYQGQSEAIGGPPDSVSDKFNENSVTFSRSTQSRAIESVVDYYTNKGIDMHFANGRTWKSYIEVIAQSDSREQMVANPNNFYTYQGNLWDYIKELRDAPFYETFWEVVDNKPSLIVRPTPFNPENWKKLEHVDVEDIELIDENTGRSDLETYSMFVVKSEATPANLNQMFGNPVWYKPYYRKYGLRRYQTTSKYIAKEEEPDINDTGIDTPGSNIYDSEKNNDIPNLKNSISSKTIDLFNWNIKNPDMENGSISLYGDEKYKVGTRLIIKHSGMEYYVEHVKHNFVYNENWTTEVEVTRGLLPEERFTAPWGEYKPFTPNDYLEITGMEAKKDVEVTTPNLESAINGMEPDRKPTEPQVVGSGKTGKMAKPVSGRITSPFGNRVHPIYGTKKFHAGVDIAAPTGTPVSAAQGGTVSYASRMDGYGNVIFVDHPDGSQTRYAHLSSIGVTKGQKVDVGSNIGKVGSTGNSTGPHLHFEVRIGGKPQNPLNYVKI